MANESTEPQETPQEPAEPDEIQEPEEPTDDDSEEVTQLKRSQKAMYEKYRAEETKRKELEQQLSEAQKPKEEPKPKQKGDSELDKRRLDKIEFRQFNPTLSPENVDYIFAVASGLGVTPGEALQREEVQAYLEKQTSQSRAEQATPSPSASPVRFNKKPWTEMSNEERKKAWESGQTLEKLRNRGKEE